MTCFIVLKRQSKWLEQYLDSCRSTCVIIAFDLLLYVKANFGVANIHSILKRNAKYKLE